MALRSKLAYTVVAACVIAAACAGTPAPASAQSPYLRPDDCLRVGRAERYIDDDPNATPPNNYGLEFSATSPRTADIHLRLYARETTYVLDLKGVAVDVPVTGIRTYYVSRPYVVAGADRHPFLGVIAAASGQARSCPPATSKFTDVSITAPPSDFRSRVLLAPVFVPASGAPPENVCETPWRDAATISRAEPIYPPGAKALDQRGTSTIEVLLDETGSVLQTSVYASSGFKALDDAAIEAVQHSTFRPKIVDCDGEMGEFLFIVRWMT